MNSKIANDIASKSINAIREAMKNDPMYQGYSIVNNGGSFSDNACTIKISFVNKEPSNNHSNLTMNNDMVSMGFAPAGSKIECRGKEYTVIKASRKFYQAVDENDKVWRVPFTESKMVK